MTVTIKDVARVAQVSTSTVSRVINNKGVISAETRDRILQVMQELNYFPNSIARNFASGNTNCIGLVIDINDSMAFSNTFFNRSVFGIETVTHIKGYNLMITNDRIGEDNVSSVEKLVFEKKVDGLIIPCSTVKRSLITKLKETDFPYVVLGEPEQHKTDTNWVDVNNIQGGEIAVNHLVQKGYKKIAFILGKEKAIFNKNRMIGYYQSINKNEIESNDEYIKSGSETVEDGYTAIKELMSLVEPPDSIICSDNIIAFGALKALKELNMRVPEDIGIISFDNYPIAEFTEPQLTTVDVDTFALGEQAANILIERIQRGADMVQQTLISTKIIERESTNRKK